MHKKCDCPKNRLFLKNPKFLPNHYETWPKLLAILEYTILTKFHIDLVKIVDFLIIAYFRPDPFLCISLYFEIVFILTFLIFNLDRICDVYSFLLYILYEMDFIVCWLFKSQ